MLAIKLGGKEKKIRGYGLKLGLVRRNGLKKGLVRRGNISCKV